jgi:hypothetical protein
MFPDLLQISYARDRTRCHETAISRPPVYRDACASTAKAGLYRMVPNTFF